MAFALVHVSIRPSINILSTLTYGQGKLTIERALCDYDTAYKLKSIFPRYFNAASAHPAMEIGEGHYPETHLISPALQAVKEPSQPIVILGNGYPTHMEPVSVISFMSTILSVHV
jgi:UDP-glucose 4-epimerase